jgi:hypothetical protein
MAQNDTDTFWRSWSSLHGNQKSATPSPVVDGVSSEKGIANIFKNVFENNCRPNNEQKVQELQVKFDEIYKETFQNHENDCNCKDYSFTFENLADAIFSLNCGKCCDNSEIYAEHFLDGPIELYHRMFCLFSGMIRHAFVPDQYKYGFVVPLIKDHQGNKCSSDNYRGITISPIMSKIFEHILRICYGEKLVTSDLQFGFKKKHSTAQALFCLKETINAYTNNGSSVYVSFLDASKAFDRVVHVGLYVKLIQRGFPKIFVDIVISMYHGMWCRVRWGSQYSDWFQVKAGVKQGGVLSPTFYSVYVDDLVIHLKHLNIGCYVRDLFLAILLYADDMALVSPSVGGLQKLLNMCKMYCDDWDIRLNHKKSKVMYFGKGYSKLCTLYLDGRPVEWVSQWRYLGIVVRSGRCFSFSVEEKIKRFYKCTNAILRIGGQARDLALLKLTESHCVPVLTYGVEVCYDVDQNELRKLKVAYNSLFRRIFGFRQRDSVRELQGFLTRPTWDELLLKCNERFLSKLRESENQVIRHLVR